MKRSMFALALVLSTLTGCFSSWAITQASGGQRILDERVREQHVPLPDVRERLRVTMPITRRYPPRPAPIATRAGEPAPTPPPGSLDPLPFALDCTSTQSANDTVYRSGFRYGRGWKKVAAAMFVIEAGIAAAVYFGADRTKPGSQLAIGFFGLDAVGTAALLFVPRKEIFRQDVEPVVSIIRSDCPAGIVLEVGGNTFPVDAAGRIGELGEAALDGWMQSPSPAAPRLTYRDRVIDLQLGQNEVCTWLRDRHHDQSACPAYWAAVPSIAASTEVPMGTLTQLE